MDYIITYLPNMVKVYITKAQKDILQEVSDIEGKVYVVNKLRFTIEPVRN